MILPLFAIVAIRASVVVIREELICFNYRVPC